MVGLTGMPTTVLENDTTARTKTTVRSVLPIMFRNAVFLACALLLLVVHAKAGTAADWRSRTIYQLLTDRFAGSAKYAKVHKLGILLWRYISASFPS